LRELQEGKIYIILLKKFLSI